MEVPEVASYEIIPIEDIKKLFIAVIDLVNVAKVDFHEGVAATEVRDVTAMQHSMAELVIEVDFTRKMPELKDVDVSELEELASLVEDNFEIEQEDVEDYVERLFKSATKLHATINDMISEFHGE